MKLVARLTLVLLGSLLLVLPFSGSLSAEGLEDHARALGVGADSSTLFLTPDTDGAAPATRGLHGLSLSQACSSLSGVTNLSVELARATRLVIALPGEKGYMAFG